MRQRARKFADHECCGKLQKTGKKTDQNSQAVARAMNISLFHRCRRTHEKRRRNQRQSVSSLFSFLL